MAIADLMKDHKLRIYLGTDNTFTSISPSFRETDPAMARHPDPSNLWKKIFSTTDGSNGFLALYQALNDDVVKRQPNVAISRNLSKIRDKMRVDKLNNKTDDHSTRVLDALAGHTTTFGTLALRHDSMNWVQTRYLDEAINAFHNDSHFLRLFALLAAQEIRSKGTEAAKPALSALADSYRTEAQSILGDNAVDWVNSMGAAFAAQPAQHRLLHSVQASVLTQLLQAGLGHPPGDAFGLLRQLASSSLPTDSGLAADLGAAMEHMLRRALDIPTTKPSGTDHFLQGRGQGQAMMRALFRNAARQHGKSRAAHPDVKEMADIQAVPSAQAQASKNFASFHQHWRNTVTPTPATKPDLEAARRKFFGIRALPGLAKFLRLTVDVELDVKLADLKTYNRVAAMFVDDPQDNQKYGDDIHHKPDLTALMGDADGQACFRPASCTTAGSVPPDLNDAIRIRNGVVDLRASESTSADPRFMISILDLPAAITSLRMKAEQDGGAQRDGTLLASVSNKTPERQSRGLQLIDNQAQHQIASHAAQTVSAQPGSQTRPFFAEDLVIGYRPYVQRFRHGVALTGDPWRSLVARKISIDDIASTLNSAAYHQVQARDHGYVRPALKAQGDSQTSGPHTVPLTAPASGVIVASPTTDGQMFAWMGASLGLSTDPGTSDAAQSGPGENSNDDLALDIEYRFSGDPQDLQPALRIGDSYRMGLAPVYPNCGGPTFEEACAVFSRTGAEIITLGDTSNGDTAFKFGPPRDIPAPAVLISDAEARDWQRSEKKATAENGNAENVARIVLRSAANPAFDKDNVKRYLVPPRASFEVAEQSGMFDNVSVAIPPGAFDSYEQNPQSGGFPNDAPAKPTKNSPQTSRSAILRPAEHAAPPKARYYPDPLARNLKVSFERNGASPEGFPESIPNHAFWKQGASPVTAQPIEIVFKRWHNGRMGGQIDFVDTTGKVASVKSGASRTVPRLAIEIAPAEEVTLRFWCVPDRSDLLRSHAVLGTHVQVAAKGLVTQALATKQPPGFNDPAFLGAVSHGVELMS
ncbi:hypothetical protein, partial [Bradyrhizobium sp.]|uniref:hypothetical protein n=1 Tax=Bradyrhizobium sp. TaxID=376 RepID=UPI003C437073